MPPGPVTPAVGSHPARTPGAWGAPAGSSLVTQMPEPYEPKRELSSCTEAQGDPASVLP